MQIHTSTTETDLKLFVVWVFVGGPNYGRKLVGGDEHTIEVAKWNYNQIVKYLL